MGVLVLDPCSWGHGGIRAGPMQLGALGAWGYSSWTVWTIHCWNGTWWCGTGELPLPEDIRRSGLGRPYLSGPGS